MATEQTLLIIGIFVLAGFDGCFSVTPEEEQNPNFWYVKGKEALHASLSMKPNMHQAKNLILFLGDGMGISTVTAARIMKGQMEGKTGEESVLAMDTFSHLALSKTYNVDQQMPDCAATATAYLCGVKANYGTLGLSAAARRKDCSSVKGNEHASPAASYSHTPERGWYSDKELASEAVTGGCKDIAYQLVHNTDINGIKNDLFTFLFLGVSYSKAEDGKSFTNALYGNGPGYQIVNVTRPDMNVTISSNDEYLQQAAVPLDSETHGSEDVAIFAKGPMAHLFHRVQEQSYIPHAMAYAACLEPYTDCLLEDYGVCTQFSLMVLMLSLLSSLTFLI
uniref:alkaline phosphatase n=1 Tax=Sinocyclocheilus rhinocerous TaxID=307959 RepID=A0A673LM22_9TELE